MRVSVCLSRSTYHPKLHGCGDLMQKTVMRATPDCNALKLMTLQGRSLLPGLPANLVLALHQALLGNAFASQSRGGLTWF